jgi:hypothetical protein
MTKTVQDLRSIHSRACATVQQIDRTLSPDVDAFWPLYLQAALNLRDVAANDVPKRAVQFRVDIGADNMRALSSALFNLSNQIAAGQLSSHSVSGGYDSGYEHWLSVSDRPTHDEYVAQLDAWLEARKSPVDDETVRTAVPLDNSAPVAAIQFALSADEGMTWLRLWNEGEFEACRREWPEASDDCYIGADLAMPETRALLGAQNFENYASDALRDVLAERQRHVDVEGWTPEHDDEHDPGILAFAGAAYALNAAYVLDLCEPPVVPFWPFSSDWWKPGTPRRSLVKATALLLSEIERIDRHPGDESGHHRSNGGDL